MAGRGQNASAALLIALGWIWYLGRVAHDASARAGAGERAGGRAGERAGVHALKDRPGFSLKDRPGNSAAQHNPDEDDEDMYYGYLYDYWNKR